MLRFRGSGDIKIAVREYFAGRSDLVGKTVVDLPAEEVVIGLPVELDWIERYGHPFPVFRKREG